MNDGLDRANAPCCRQWQQWLLSLSGTLMFSRDGEFWSQLAAYLYAVIVALSVLYGIGQLLTGDTLDLSLKLG